MGDKPCQYYFQYSYRRPLRFNSILVGFASERPGKTPLIFRILRMNRATAFADGHTRFILVL